MLMMKRARVLWVSLAVIIIIYAAVQTLYTLGYRLSYQYSPSMPEGWYFIAPNKDYNVGDDVLFEPSSYWQSYIYHHGWSPSKKTLLLKQIVAQSGDYVCIKQKSLYINQNFRGKLFSQDSQGQDLPRYEICRALVKDEYFVLGVSADNSFDSRYYGIIYRKQIIGKAAKL